MQKSGQTEHKTAEFPLPFSYYLLSTVSLYSFLLIVTPRTSILYAMESVPPSIETVFESVFVTMQKSSDIPPCIA